MPIAGTVGLTNTFDDWRSKTNDTIIAYNQLESANVQFVSTTPSVLQINGVSSGNGMLSVFAPSNVVSLTCNALPSYGGTLTGNLVVGAAKIFANGMITIGTTMICANGDMIFA